ncbi:hypothetical protein [Aliidiomarina soli]|nr:hypothetical protein [Aliidiomarina soli]
MVSSITGGTVNINVDGHTQVTGSLDVAGLTNRSHSSNYTYQNENS